ncbi:glycogen debranching enzyme [Bicyclus anynana]|uniref:Glycogen debranching enzyme n=1 Tax=Bicyclus anynana TaxID=110368 RepID=A0ABM3LGZ0_BICAN|nr:glycogen debranching enzyme [Bicyclus anynana]
MAVERAEEGAEAGAGADDVRVLTLEHGEHLDSTLYRFDKGTRLQFAPGASLLGRKVFLYTNYVGPDDADEGAPAEFVRNQYRALEWRGAADGEPGGGGLLVADDDAHCELRLVRAGAFHYYFVYDSPESRVGPQGSGWFHVAPSLGVPLDGVVCQTVLAKCLGPLPRWRGVLRVAHEAGYNALHLTPLQALGASGSGYSIADQLRVDPRYRDPAAARDPTFADVARVLGELRADWGVLLIGDVVLNHTANESPWLEEHPEATYNCHDCPHLRPAALLDELLARLSADVARGALEPAVPRRLCAPEHVEALRAELLERRLPEARLHELFTCDADELVRRFRERAQAKAPPAAGAGAGAGELRLVRDPQRRRLAATVDMELALQLYNVYRPDCYDEEARLQRCCAELRRRLQQLNDEAEADARAHLLAAVDNCAAGVRYERLQADGPRLREVSERHPLVPRYFTFPPAGSLADAEALLCGPRARLVQAHNGWVMGADPLQDFAAPERDARVYLRRELVAWGDSVKLRYGARPEDCPALWARMRRYVELAAELFDGVRLDNCHSTPLHVAEYMLDCARRVRPELYVVAELFTNCDQVDNIFVNRLGVTSLVREAMSAGDARELGRLVHRFGGRAVGSFLRAPRRPAAPAVAHALLMDLTHDNPSPLERRSALDALPSAALVAAACCAAGSTRGYDELVPHHVHVVDEERLYAEWADGEPADEGRVGAASALLAARRALNELHRELAAAGYDEVYVDQMDADVVAVTRHDPASRRSVVLVAFTAFARDADAAPARAPPPLRFEGRLEEILLEADVRREPAPPFARHPRFVNGLRSLRAHVRRAVPLAESRVFAGARRDGALTELRFRPLAPGAVVALRVAPHARAAAALGALGGRLRALAAGADALALAPALAPLGAADYRVLLYCCEAEERERCGAGAYEVPGHGALPYAGLAGAAPLLARVAAADELGHALCANLRAGDWLAQYAVRRLEADARLAPVAARYRDALAPLEELPRFLVPAYFEAVMRALYEAVSAGALARLGDAARGGPMARALALTSVQLAGAVPSAPLPPPAPAGAPSLSAGLPHFAVGYMRCWGRDTFVALRGLFLLTGRYDDARHHILAFGACLRHGLIPNLLDGGRRARYNCRDAVWWWLRSVQQYCDEAPDGAALLAAAVPRLFPADDAAPAPPGAADQPLHDVVQEALDVHFQGLVFRERDAGRQIDAHMADRGFNVQIGVDPETGFPFGGNDANCGTWMDKMGSSDAAGTRGRPATPRDGSAVELVALCHAAVSWLERQHRAGRHPYPGVARRHRDGALTAWSWAQWAERLRRHFERHFWVPPAPSAADARPDLVHRRGIYKDSHGASQPWADYQLRCNFAVAMAVAPELFEPRHARLALDSVERLLRGPLGLKTLDPADWAYRPHYDNADDSADPATAHGFNYHQGPEWVWPLGFYLRARLAFAERPARAAAHALAALAPLLRELRASPWAGLPELTGADGAFCRDSCRTQAWSSACVLEVLHELAALRRARPLPPA